MCHHAVQTPNWDISPIKAGAYDPIKAEDMTIPSFSIREEPESANEGGLIHDNT
jgi:hypothetical protein